MMALRLYDGDLTQVLLERTYPESYRTSGDGITECTTCLDYPIGKGYYKEIFFDGVHIGFGNASLKKRVRLGFESDFETVEMHFALKGKSAARAETFERAVCFESYQHNIIYANGMCGNMTWEASEFRLCEINLAPVFFMKFLPADMGAFDRFRNAIANGKSALLGNANSPINHGMYRILEEITTCQRQGVFKRMFLEAKVIEILLLQLEQFAVGTLARSSLKRSDMDKLHAVRGYILTNLDSTYSLVDLAHHVGTNEFMLKRGFKELFGTTVFGFWNDAKMEQAKRLLAESGMNVGEVSDAIGYKNQRHFCTAFKRKFGIVPSRMKSDLFFHERGPVV